LFEIAENERGKKNFKKNKKLLVELKLSPKFAPANSN
jgi:hypothetical protein